LDRVLVTGGFLEERSIVSLEHGSAATLIPAGHEELRVASVGRWRPVWKRRLVTTALIVSDALFALLVWEVASVLQGVWGRGPLNEVSAITMVPVTAVWVAMRALLGLYPGYGLNSVEQLRRHTYATLAALGVLAFFALGFQVGEQLSRLLLILSFLGLLLLAPLVRYLAKLGMKGLELWGEPVVILSYGEMKTEVVALLKQNWELGYDPLAVFDYSLDMAGRRPAGSADTQQALSGAADLGLKHGVCTAIFAMPHTRREQLAELVNSASRSFRQVLVIPNLGEVTNSAVVARDLAGTFAVEVKYNLLNPWALRAKRVTDLVATVVGGAVVLPLLIVLALVVYLESGGPVFYKDRRMGQDGKLFPCLKFRTMVRDAEPLLQRMLEEDVRLREQYMKYHKLLDDPRVTRAGRFLRKTSLDELPQLWNVLRGEMSLVGPRPYLPRESQDIGPAQMDILRVPPGITGPWQVAGRNRTFFSQRVQMDSYYVRDWSIWLDIVILARTVRIVLSRGAAY
jgi:Undecaprenyl-phosphate galactose phosphotransferase WbaP